ncbi:cysteine synthase family protein [Pseudomonas tohonis]|uniref:cysteine synthase family protein n=1 Tax=Pseudomonas tohonis TaxID=2725477 RepID=UPI0021D9D593|nr:PLP-dependent cysteine synthase family protein [Pseudomonas tohonis]UXY53183.1 PLP-dependent cysteine synthase family protein [Pseudomonas tohonis]
MLAELGLHNVGNTRMHRVISASANGNKIFAKCEFMNPTGSHKDRTFLHMVTELESAGKIAPGMTLVDCSTGNGGAALAWVGKMKGYNVVIFMPEGMTEERKRQIREFGADIIETNRNQFLNGSVQAAKDYVADKPSDKFYFLDQGSSLLNKSAWIQCGNEIAAQLEEQKEIPDYFVCSIGTGGTFSGISEVLKARYPNIKTIGIEVDRSAPLYAKKNNLEFCHRPHNMMGLGAGVLSCNTNEQVIDEVVVVDGAYSWNRMKKFIEEEQLGVGPTCGANLYVCEQLSRAVTGKTIVTLFFDSAWKYKSRWSGVYPEYNGG